MIASHRSLDDLVGCRHPLQLAPMGAIVTPELAAAVIRAGGLGMVPGRSPDQVQALTRQVRALADGAVGVGILAQWADRALAARAGDCADVVDFFWGDPDATLVEAAKSHGALVAWHVGSVCEAIGAAMAGCDFISVQGFEAGGHLRGRVSLDRLLLETVAAVDLPVVAAGGIGSPERVEELLAAGAAGVRIGTRFLAASEADVHPQYLAALIDAAGTETCVTTAFEVGWPDAPHRVLCSAIGEAERLAAADAGVHEGEPLPRFSSMPPRRATTGQISAMALYAGTSVGTVTREQPAADIVAELMGR
jgi:NAD(P)H-dependent flavin oxidoreductase YrpB (nitropropane dioxygenase family)